MQHFKFVEKAKEQENESVSVTYDWHYYVVKNFQMDRWSYVNRQHRYSFYDWTSGNGNILCMSNIFAIWRKYMYIQDLNMMLKCDGNEKFKLIMEYVLIIVWTTVFSLEDFRLDNSSSIVWTIDQLKSELKFESSMGYSLTI